MNFQYFFLCFAVLCCAVQDCSIFLLPTCIKLTKTPERAYLETQEKMSAELKALILLADGTEEMEAVITCDILVRAGINLTRASVGLSSGSPIICANGMKLLADTTLEEIMCNLSDFSMIILPGGSKGATTFSTVQIFNFYLCFKDDFTFLLG